MNQVLTLDNGWIVKKATRGKPVLYVTPIPNTLFKKNQTVEITEAIFKDVSLGEIDTKKLFKKHKLHILIMEQGAKRIKPVPKPKINTEDKYQGVDFFVAQEGDKYFLEYRLARHGDGSRKFEITKEIYQEARTGKYATSDLFKKYNLYHLDVSENDVQ